MTSRFNCGEYRFKATYIVINCFKVIMLIPNLLLQKPYRNSKSKDHLLVLDRKLELWGKGELDDFFLDREKMQAPLKT